MYLNHQTDQCSNIKLTGKHRKEIGILNANIFFSQKTDTSSEFDFSVNSQPKRTVIKISWPTFGETLTIKVHNKVTVKKKEETIGEEFERVIEHTQEKKRKYNPGD